MSGLTLFFFDTLKMSFHFLIAHIVLNKRCYFFLFLVPLFIKYVFSQAAFKIFSLAFSSLVCLGVILLRILKSVV